MSIGDKIRKVRELKGFKQEYVAKELGMSVTAYGNIERNASGLTFDRLEEIAKVLEVAVQDILNIPEQLNIHSITQSQQIGFKQKNTYNDNRTDSTELEGYKIAISSLEKENGFLKQQVAQLMELLGKKVQ